MLSELIYTLVYAPVFRLFPVCSSFLLHIKWKIMPYKGFPHSPVSKESTCNAGDLGSISGSGRSPGEGNGNPCHYSCLENPMDRGAWQATVHGVSRVGHDLVLSFFSLLPRHSCSIIVAHGVSCPETCEIFLDQGFNPCPLHWQVDS